MEKVGNYTPKVGQVAGPKSKIRVGAITATIWENQTKLPNGQNVATFSVNLARNYQDTTGTWKETTSFKTNDIPKAILALQKAYESLVLKE